MSPVNPVNPVHPSNPADPSHPVGRSVPLVVACAALTRELRAILAANGLAEAIEVVYLASALHNRPERIVDELRPHLEAAQRRHRPVFVAYADCGTGGGIDRLLAEYPGVRRLPGAHCYEVFAGAERFAALAEAEMGTFYLTDYLARHFDALVWCGLGLDRHPELLGAYFAHYRRVVFLRQADDPGLDRFALGAAERLGLPLEVVTTGVHGLEDVLRVWARGHEVGAPHSRREAAGAPAR